MKFVLLILFSSTCFAVSLEAIAKQKQEIFIDPVTIENAPIVAITTTTENSTDVQAKNFAGKVCAYSGYDHLKTYSTVRKLFDMNAKVKSFSIYADDKNSLPITYLNTYRAGLFRYWGKTDGYLIVLKTVTCAKNP